MSGSDIMAAIKEKRVQEEKEKKQAEAEAEAEIQEGPAREEGYPIKQTSCYWKRLRRRGNNDSGVDITDLTGSDDGGSDVMA